MSNWGCFDEFSSDQAEETTQSKKPIEKERHLEDVLPFKSAEYENKSDFQTPDSQVLDVQAEQPNYYGQSEEFWEYIFDKNSPDINLRITLCLDTPLIGEQPTLAQVKDPGKEPEKDPGKNPEDNASFNLSSINNPRIKVKYKPPKGRPGYGSGHEAQKLSKDPHNNTAIDECYLYKNLRDPSHANVKKLGEWYNDDFSKYFLSPELGFSKFSRNQFRKKNIAFWFFEELLQNGKTNPIILPWLNEKIMKLNSI